MMVCDSDFQKYLVEINGGFRLRFMDEIMLRISSDRGKKSCEEVLS